jgi:hypothetical protein
VAFRENAVTAALLPNLTADDLKDLGITLVGHRRQLLDAIAALRSQAVLAEPVAAVSPSPPVDPTGQHDTSQNPSYGFAVSASPCSS